MKKSTKIEILENAHLLLREFKGHEVLDLCACEIALLVCELEE